MPESSHQRNKEEYNKPDEFGRALGHRALQEARKKKGSEEITEPVEFEATVTVTPTGSLSVCLNFALVSVCYHFEES